MSDVLPELALASIILGSWIDTALESAQWWGLPVVSTIAIGVMVRLTPTGQRRRSRR